MIFLIDTAMGSYWTTPYDSDAEDSSALMSKIVWHERLPVANNRSLIAQGRLVDCLYVTFNPAHVLGVVEFPSL